VQSRPATGRSNRAEALKVLRTMTVDLALLDVALGGETVLPLSRMLESLGVPFIFVTGNPALLLAEYSARPLGAQAVGADGAPVADTPGAGRAARRPLERDEMNPNRKGIPKRVEK
jgi:CheY-like chemotaxis protein